MAQAQQPQAQTQAQAQLSVANFKPGTYIIIENKKDHDYFFIVRTGKIQVDSSVNALLNTKSRILNPGDFFGVIGAMTGHPRIESAIAAEAASLIAVKKSQFGFLIQKNTPLAMKIIRSFSKELRTFDTELAKRTTKGSHDEENPDNLYHNSEYYFKANNYQIAAYIYLQYIKVNPSGTFINEAKSRLSSMRAVKLEKFKPRTDFNRVYEDGEMMFSEYEPGHELFIIQEGKVKITKIINKTEVLLAVLNPGDIFGEMALLDDKNRAASAIAFGTTKVMAVNRANFDKIVIQNAQMATKLITLLSDRVWTIYKQLANLMFSDPVGRLYDTLLTQMLKQHVPLEEKKAHQFSFGSADLLKMVGMSGPESDAALKKLLAHRSITIVDNKIHCNDVIEIKKEVDFALKMQARNLKLAESKKIN